MSITLTSIIRSVLLPSLLAAGFAWGVPVATAQGQTASPAAASPQASIGAKPANELLFRDYKGVTIGLSAQEARQKLGNPKEEGTKQDFFAFSDKESVQVYYDKEHKVRAISVNYIGNESGAPTPMAILGTEIEAKANGSMHKLVRYPAAGYWVSYSRTAGDTPLVTVTMQRMRLMKR